MTVAAVAEEVFARHARHWKPGTMAVNRSYLRRQILPTLGDRPVADVDRAEVRRWHAGLHATPAAANRALPILSTILRQAEIYGYRPEGSNPCSGVRHHRQRRRHRFLSADEYRRLGAALAAHDARRPIPVAAVRLLALTGCRQREIRRLRWSEYRAGNLFLSDSKTGPRTVWLSSAARAVIDARPRGGDWILPGVRTGARPLSTDVLYDAWARLLDAADLPGLRLHDLRHSFASYALRSGETVLTIGRLLGHRRPETTLKYVHFADSLARAAVEQVGAALEAGA